MNEFLNRQRTGTVCTSDRLFPAGLAGSRSPHPGSQGPDHRVRGPVTRSAKQHNLEHTPRVGISGDLATARVMLEHPQAGRLCAGEGAREGSRAVVLLQCGWRAIPLPGPGQGHLLLKGLCSSKLQKTPTKKRNETTTQSSKEGGRVGRKGHTPLPCGGQGGQHARARGPI